MCFLVLHRNQKHTHTHTQGMKGFFALFCVKPKRESEKLMILTSLQFFSVLCSIKDLLTRKLSLHTPNSSFLAMTRKEKEKNNYNNKDDEPSMVGQILWNPRCFYSTEFLFISILIYLYIYIIFVGGNAKLTITCSFVDSRL